MYSSATTIKHYARASAWLLWGVTLIAAAEPGTQHHTGCAYDLNSGRLLYTEAHVQRWEGDRNLGGTVAYYDPQGQQIAAKTLDFSVDPQVPVYRLEIPDQRYTEGITDHRDTIILARASRDGGQQSKRINRKSPIAADAGTLQFVQTNFEALLKGEVLRLRLAVASRLDVYSVRIRRAMENEADGQPVVRFRIEHDSPLRLLLDPVEMTYDRQSRRLLEYRGTSNMRDSSTGDAYTVRITYTPD
ncbi:MAG: hypothetical protein ACRESW_09170, partial [Nevskiales bacterium]